VRALSANRVRTVSRNGAFRRFAGKSFARRRLASIHAALPPKCVRVLSPDAIASTMLLKSNSKGVRQAECNLSVRACRVRALVCVKALRKTAAGC
jgi:hypothetical protein